eukprot:170488_1
MSHHIFPSNLLFALRIPDHTYILYTVSIWVMFLSVTMLCVAEEAFIKISITTAANDARSASGTSKPTSHSTTYVQIDVQYYEVHEEPKHVQQPSGSLYAYV